MRKLLFLILSVFISVASHAIETDVITSENTPQVTTTESVEQITDGSLFFTAEILASAIAEIIPEKNQSAAATQYEKVMNPENGRIKVEGLFSVCRAGGFNTYREVGFNDCKKFINKLLTDSQQESGDRLLGGYCPGLDINGKNPNVWATITDKNKVGDFCSSSNIAVGEIAYNQTVSKRSKTDYSCTCVASSCNPGFEFKGGACKLIVADGQGFCLRSEHPETSENNTTQKCVDFCGVVATKKGCKYSSIVMRHSTKQCLCNPTNNEIDLAKDSMIKAEQGRLAKLPYYEVCGQHRGKTGAKEYCISDIFTWTNVGQLQAVSLAKEYARVRLGQTIQCDSKYRESGNDDWIKCVGTDGRSFYEFKFDDVKESVDGQINQGVVLGIYAIHNMTLNSATCTPGVIVSAKVFGYTAKMQNNICRLNYTKMTADDAEQKLAKIDGIDNRVFFHGIQVQGSAAIIAKLKTYIQGQGIRVNTFTCDSGLGKIDNSWMGGKDDILRCYMNGAPIDFVFDDFSEAWKYVQEAGDSGIQCIVSGGIYQGSNCHGLTQTQCTQSNIALKKEFPGISGTKWQNGMCVLVDASQAATYDILVQVGVGLVAAVDCVVLTHTGCAILAVELAGLATEVTANVAIGNRAEDFLKESVKCKSRNCAVTTLRDLSGKVLSVKSSLKPQDLHAVDSELSRLVGLLDSLEDLGGADLSGAEWEDIVTKLGGDPGDSAGTALVWASRVGLVAQFASIGASALRLTGAAVAKLGAKSVKTGSAGTRAITAVEKNIIRAEGQLTKTSTGTAAATKQTTKLEKLTEEAAVLDRVAKGTTTEQDLAKIAADGNKTLRQSARQITTQTKNAEEIATDGAKLKRYEQLTSKAKLTVSEQQELNTIRNAWGNPPDELIIGARGVQNKMADAAELQKNQDELAKFDDWANKNPGAAKNIGKAREAEIAALRKKVGDVSGDVTAPRTASVADDVPPAAKAEVDVNKLDYVAKQPELGISGRTEQIEVKWSNRNVTKIYADDGNIYYLKATADADEVARTRSAQNYFKNNKGILNSVSALSDDVAEQTARLNNIYKPNRGINHKWIITESAPGQYKYKEFIDNPELLNIALGGGKISRAEADKLIKEISDMNTNGIIHGDIQNNLILSRNTRGELEATLLDWEHPPVKTGRTDVQTIEGILERLQEVGLTDELAVTRKAEAALNAEREASVAAKKIVDDGAIAHSTESPIIKYSDNAVNNKKFVPKDSLDNLVYMDVKDGLGGLEPFGLVRRIKGKDSFDGKIVSDDLWHFSRNDLSDANKANFDDMVASLEKQGYDVEVIGNRAAFVRSKAITPKIEQVGGSARNAENTILTNQVKEAERAAASFKAPPAPAINPIDDILEISGRKAVFRSGSGNSLGQDYYRVIVNDNDNIDNIVTGLQNKGYYVSANMTEGGERFLGVSREPVFSPWNGADGNFLRNSAKATPARAINQIDEIKKIDAIFGNPDQISPTKNFAGLDFNLSRAADNSAGVQQWRLAARTEEEADQIVSALKANGQYAGKMQKGAGNWQVTVADNADDWSKMENLGMITPPKKAGILSVPVDDVAKGVEKTNGGMSDQAARSYADKISEYTGVKPKITVKNGNKVLEFDAGEIMSSGQNRFKDGVAYSGFDTFEGIGLDGRKKFFIDLDASRNTAQPGIVSDARIFNNNYQTVNKPISATDEIEYTKIINKHYSSGSKDIAGEQALRRAFQDAGVWDLKKASQMSRDLESSLIQNLKQDADIVNGIKNWDNPNFTIKMKEDLLGRINYMLGSERRVHTGNTVFGVNDGHVLGKHMAGGNNALPGGGNWLRYDIGFIGNSSFDEVMGLLVHENLHGFQNVGKSSVGKEYLDMAKKYYSSKGFSDSLYTNAINEVEARFFQSEIGNGFSRRFLNSL